MVIFRKMMQLTLLCLSFSAAQASEDIHKKILEAYRVAAESRDLIAMLPDPHSKDYKKAIYNDLDYMIQVLNYFAQVEANNNAVKNPQAEEILRDFYSKLGKKVKEFIPQLDEISQQLENVERSGQAQEKRLEEVQIFLKKFK